MSELVQAIAAELKDQGGCRYFEPRPRVEERPGVWSPVSYTQMVDIGVVNVDALAAVVEAYLRPVVTTVEELRELFSNTVILDPLGYVYTNLDGSWYGPADEASTAALCIALPATVLYQPAQEKP